MRPELVLACIPACRVSSAHPDQDPMRSRPRFSSSRLTVALFGLAAAFTLTPWATPPVGHLLHLSQHQFAVWAAIAIHDTSSVVGAAASYGPVALEQATVLKLAR